MSKGRIRLPVPAADILTVAVSTGAVFFLLAFGGKALEAYRLERHNAGLRNEVAALEEQQAQLQAERDYVQTPEYVEKVAREQYRWTKVGENLVITIFRQRSSPQAGPLNQPGGPLSVSRVAVASGPPYWGDWLRLLTGPFD
jgi:cell division protein FtsB